VHAAGSQFGKKNLVLHDTKFSVLIRFSFDFFSWPEHTLYPVWTLGFTLVKSKRYLFNVKQTCQQVTRVNSANVLDEGLRIGEIGRRMNSKVKLVEIGVYRK
jgi:hypothetical protein